MKKKEYKNYFILIITILLMVFVTTRFTNVFGSNTDWINQHTVIPDYFRQLFYQTGNLLPNFAFHYGGGQNIFNLSYYGLLSPIILPSYLFPFIDMMTYMTLVNIIILIASGILFYKWLRSHNYNDKISLITSLLVILADSFIFHMHRHIMFVNYMPFLIMALMGVDKLIKDNKKSFLVISIFLMIMTSYYYSVCGILVVCIYYLYEYLNNNDKITVKLFFQDGFKFIGLIFTSIFMAGILLLPTAYTLFSGRGDSQSGINLLSLFIPNLHVGKVFVGTYAIGLSLLAFISLLYLFYTKKKNNIILGVILCLVLFLPIFRFILNGGLYLREKCFIPFMPLFGFLIAYFIDDLFNDKIDVKKFIIYLLIIMIPLYLINVKEYSYLYVLGFIIVLFLFSRYKNKKIVCFYLIIASFATTFMENLNEDYVSIENYNKYFDKNISTDINEILLNDDNYFRSNNLIYPTKTINKVYDSRYYTTNIYSSTYNENYLNFVRNFFETSMVEYNYFMVPASNNLLFNMFMGVKYLNSDYDPGLGYTKIGDNVYVNENVFPMFYATNNILSEREFDKYNYPFQTELLLKNVIVDGNSSNSDIDINISKTNLGYEIVKMDGIVINKENGKFILEVSDKGNITLKLNNELENKILFIDIFGLKENSCSYDNISMKINNVENVLTCRTWIYANKNNIFRYVISDEKINELNIELSKGIYNIDDVQMYLLDYDNIKNLKDTKKEFNITSMENDKIIGNIDVSSDSYFVTTLPYDEGFTVKVNGIEVSYEMINKGFVGFPIKSGHNEIEITYNSPWLDEGKAVSAFGVIIFIVISVFDYRKKKF